MYVEQRRLAARFHEQQQQAAANDPVAKLQQLKDMLDKGLITQDIKTKEEQLKRAVEDYDGSRDLASLADHYRSSILGFFKFLTVMKGRYHEASFQEKRNALEVLGVKVYLHPPVEAPSRPPVVTEQEWLSIREASALSGISETTLFYHIRHETLTAHSRNIPMMVIHRDELEKYLKRPRK